MAGISRTTKAGARRLAAALAVVAGSGLAGGGMACGGSMSQSGAPAPPATADVPLSRVLVLGTSGPAPHDTAVTFRAGERRVILFPHAPPDNLLFAEFVFPPSAFAADSGRDVTVRLHARLGVYGVDVEADAVIGDSAYVTFNYPRYFAAPATARTIYGSDVAFERALAVGRLQTDSTLTFLPVSRPAPDNLRAPIPSAGTYFVAAPR